MNNRSDIFKEKVAKDPNNSLFRYSLAQALFDEKQYADAQEHLQFCVSSREDWMMPRILLGKSLLETGDVEAAKPILADALQLAVDQDHDDPAAELREILADLD
ncbi:tetratricopeptide repeat protein [Cerasicoccus frondis]|uniref:tetratricopeptide repeat protein n=1 Tax=Cerasicoccus frondis TaxID=490090 RepID=UPI002852B7FF|nr:molecular chaperone DnaJ [Cerasicoccus frondis]